MSTTWTVPENYLALVTTEHKDLPLYDAFLRIFLQGQVDLMNQMWNLSQLFDVDTANGLALDWIGARVGIGRGVPTPITGVYFAWDTDGVGWEQGVWQGPFDPDEGITEMADPFYRLVLKAKIAANQWDGTNPGAAEVWATAFGPGVVQMTDHQDMSITIEWKGAAPDALTKALFQQGFFTLKPAGVSVTEVI